MKKVLFCIFLFTIVFYLTGCTEELEQLEKDLDNIQESIDESEYVYPDSKDVVVTLDTYNKIENGMSENQVWEIIGGQCTNNGTTDLGIGNEYVTVMYGCNGNGSIGSNVVLMFQGGKLESKSQIGLK